jgi:hypothetical protein
MVRTVEQRNNGDGFVKAGELVEVRAAHLLTLQDGRIYNEMVAYAWDKIDWDDTDRAATFSIPIFRLRGYSHKGSERVRDSINRLMETVVEVPWRDSKGRKAILRTTLISGTVSTVDEEAPLAEISYSFSPQILKVIKNSKHWARIRSYVTYNLSSKYALRLYEVIALRINLNASRQDFTVEEFRNLLGVEPGKLDRYQDFRRYALDPAVLEVNGLTDYMVEVEPLREGGPQRGRLKGYRLSWRGKDHQEQLASGRELLQPRLGRKARLSGRVEEVRF